MTEQMGFEGLVAETVLNLAKDLEEANTMTEISNDFPRGTTLKLTTKKYLWGVLGATSLEVPVKDWTEINALIEEWFEVQKDLEEAYADEIKELYSRSYKSSDKPRASASGGDDEDKKKDMRGLAFTIGTQKGVYVMQKWPNVGTMSAAELGEVLDELGAMPDKMAKTAAGEGDDAAEAASTRVRRARGSRRK